MPYISKEVRHGMDKIISDYLDYLVKHKSSIGELNYLITKIILMYNTHIGDGRYSDYNDLMGVLECAKFELYRRRVGPYEDTKLKENGDVY